MLQDILDQVEVEPVAAQLAQAPGAPSEVGADVAAPVGEPVAQPPIIANPTGIVGPAPAAAPASGGIDELLAQFGPLLEKIKEQRGNSAEKAAADNAALARTELQAPPAPFPEANLKPLPTKPDFQFRDTMEAFQTPGVVLAMFGSLFTRAPITAAFRSAAAAMNGVHAGDKTLYEKAQQDYKDHLDLAIKQNGMEIETYRQALEKRNTTWAERQARLNALMAANKDVIGLASIERGDMSLVFQVLQMKENAQDRAIQARALAEDRKDRREETERHNRAAEANQSDLYGVRKQQAQNQADAIAKRVTGTERERAKKDFFVLDDKLEKEGTLSPEEWRSYQDLQQQLYGPKNYVAGPDILQVPQVVPTLGGGSQAAPAAAAPSGAAPVAPSAAQPRPAPPPPVQPTQVPGGPVMSTTRLPNGVDVTRIGPPKDVPASELKEMNHNASQVALIDDAIKALKEYPEALDSWGRYFSSFTDVTSSAWNAKDPKGIAPRAKVGKVGAIELHDLSGAAVTNSEFPRFRDFIPLTSDGAAVAIGKLQELRNGFETYLRNQYASRGPTSGYRNLPEVERSLYGLPIGYVEGGYRFIGPDRTKPESWVKVQ